MTDVYIPITKGQKFLKISIEDWDAVSQYTWFEGGGLWRYVVAWSTNNRKTRKAIKLHRFIMKADKSQIVDHINGDILDNRRSNLRFCTVAQNNYNRKVGKQSSSGIKGVFFDSRYGKYMAYIGGHKTRKYLGTFDDPLDAARAYNDAALLAYGEFARLNEVGKP